MYDQDQELINDESTHTWSNDDLLLLQSALMMDDMWTKEDELLFQSALVMVPADLEGRWEKIAERVPGKTAEDVLAYYEALVCDVTEIESGRVDLPSYVDDDEDEVEENVVVKKKRGRKPMGSLSGDQSRSQNNEKRKKGTPWSEEEHRRFLDGLNKYGKGDWRSISRNSVVTRTPTQVASHAQKYFQRQTSRTKERKRSSIHDITINNTYMVVQPTPQPQPPPTPSLSPSPSPPLTNFYGGVEQPSTKQPNSFHGTTMMLQPPPQLTPSPPTTNLYGGVQQLSTPQAASFHGSIMVAQVPPQPTPSPASNNFYGVTQQQPSQPPTSFNGSTMVVHSYHGVQQGLPTPSPPPTNIHHGAQQPPTPPFTYINGGQGGAPPHQQQQQMGYEHQQNFGNPY